MSERHLLSIRHLPEKDIETLIKLSQEFKASIIKGESIPQIKNKVLGLLFFENSTRTRVSFEQAAYYLGVKTCNFASGASSMSKGETLKDTILTLKHERLNGLVMRHRMSGSPQLAAKFFGGPVLNAGDGQHEHPTQAIGDAITIIERLGKLKGRTIAIVGDVRHSRVARSNAWLLSKMGATVRFVGPRNLLPSNSSSLPGEPYFELASGIAGADVVMTLRLQKERMSDGHLGSIGEYASLYQVNKDVLKHAKPECLVMHPGPINRGVEVDDKTADGIHSVINAQVENGVFARVAALHWVFADKEASA